MFACSPNSSFNLVLLKVGSERLLVVLVVPLDHKLVGHQRSHNQRTPVLKRRGLLNHRNVPEHEAAPTNHRHYMKRPQLVPLKLVVQVLLVLRCQPVAVVETFKLLLPGVHSVVFSRHILILINLINRMPFHSGSSRVSFHVMRRERHDRCDRTMRSN